MSALSGVKRALTDVFSSPVLLLSYFVLLVVVLFASSSDDKVKANLLKYFSDGSAKDFINKHYAKLVGLACFLPLIMSSRQKYQPLIIVAVVFWVFLVPEASPLEYYIQSILLLVMFESRGLEQQLLCVALIFVCYWAGFVHEGVRQDLSRNSTAPKVK